MCSLGFRIILTTVLFWIILVYGDILSLGRDLKFNKNQFLIIVFSACFSLVQHIQVRIGI